MLRDYKPDLKKVSISITNALEEDIGLGDVTGELINASLSIQAKLICREETVLCGKQWFTEAFKQLDPNISIKWNKQEGDLISANTELALLKGNAKCMVASERTGLNFLQMMSGIAYKTHKYVSSLSGSNTKLLDTRKTLPGLRYEQKYSVLVGGGENHRMGLYDAALVKENHIASAGSIENAVNSLKSKGIQSIEVEVESLQQLEEALNSGAAIAMLDNFDNDSLKKAAEIAKEKIKLELDNLKKTERPHVIQAISVAREHGDLKENAEYHAAKEKQAFIEGRITELEDVTSRAEVIDLTKLSGETVTFGTKVNIVDEESDQETNYQIVGPYEANLEEGLISVASPIARALIGKEVGMSVAVKTPGGTKNYEILTIEVPKS